MTNSKATPNPASNVSPNIFRGAIDKGLEGVVACSTKISAIQDTTLCYRGYTIEDLAANSSFEETVYLLWNDRLPKATELEAFRKELFREMTVPQGLLNLARELVHAFPKEGHPMDFLRTLVSTSAFYDPEVDDSSVEANRRKATRLTARMGPLVIAFDRLRKGLNLLTPVEGRSLAWNFLWMLSGEVPKDEHVRIFDTALVLHADHEINCSTFSARVTTSSLSDLYSAIVSAIGTLKGPLHGGANEKVMEMLSQLPTIEKARAFVEQALAGKEKIMGIGHRVYKNGDPRAKILRTMSQQLTTEMGRPELYDISVFIDETMQEKKGLMPNVDFYSATVYRSLNIPTDIFTPVFAVSRIAGWCAHVAEQASKNRIYRPRGEYVGKTERHWTPLESR